MLLVSYFSALLVYNMDHRLEYVKMYSKTLEKLVSYLLFSHISGTIFVYNLDHKVPR